jgi:hypothetical protein
MRAEQYRRYALECLSFAREMTSGSRTILVDMAQKWLALAAQAEKNDRTELVYEPPLPKLKGGPLPGDPPSEPSGEA